MLGSSWLPVRMRQHLGVAKGGPGTHRIFSMPFSLVFWAALWIRLWKRAIRSLAMGVAPGWGFGLMRLN